MKFRPDLPPGAALYLDRRERRRAAARRRPPGPAAAPTGPPPAPAPAPPPAPAPAGFCTCSGPRVFTLTPDSGVLERLADALDAAWERGGLTPGALDEAVQDFRARHPYRPGRPRLDKPGGRVKMG